MSPALGALLFCLGGIGGFSAGLLGFGGGVLMFPLLLYAPPLFGFAAFEARVVAAMVVTQVFFSTFIGGLAHLRNRQVHTRLVLLSGTVSAIGSFGGGIASRWVSNQFLVLLFGLVTLGVIVLMFLPSSRVVQDDVALEDIKIATLPVTLISLATGIIVGFLGAGNFIFVPFLIYLLGVPTRVAIGSNLFIAVISTASGFAGKLLSGQIPFMMTATVVCGAGLGALLGERTHRRLSTHSLRHIYAALVGLIAVRVWLTILGLAG